MAHTVTFPGNSFPSPPRQHVIHNLLVRTNDVGFVDSPLFIQPAVVTVASSDPSEPIIIGEQAGDVAILNMTLSGLSGANASIGLVPGGHGHAQCRRDIQHERCAPHRPFRAGHDECHGRRHGRERQRIHWRQSGLERPGHRQRRELDLDEQHSLTVGSNARLDVNDGGVVSVVGGLQVNFMSLT